MAALNYPMSKVMKEVTLSVRFTGEKRAWLRLWLGAKLMILAAWVAGCGITIDSSLEPPTSGDAPLDRQGEGQSPG